MLAHGGGVRLIARGVDRLGNRVGGASAQDERRRRGMTEPVTGSPRPSRRCARGVGTQGRQTRCEPRWTGILLPGQPTATRVRAVVSPHAGLVYSGPVAGHAYRGRVAPALRRHRASSGPRTSTGSTAWPCGAAAAFATPLGALDDRREDGGGPVVRRPRSCGRPGRARPRALAGTAAAVPRRLFPGDTDSAAAGRAPARRDGFRALARRWRRCCARASRCSSRAAICRITRIDRRHARLDAVVNRHVERNDPDGLQASLEADPSARLRRRPDRRRDAGGAGARRDGSARPPLTPTRATSRETPRRWSGT